MLRTFIDLLNVVLHFLVGSCEVFPIVALPLSPVVTFLAITSNWQDQSQIVVYEIIQETVSAKPIKIQVQCKSTNEERGPCKILVGIPRGIPGGIPPRILERDLGQDPECPRRDPKVGFRNGIPGGICRS